jgi:hydrogenase-4 transcriptional activator
MRLADTQAHIAITRGEYKEAEEILLDAGRYSHGISQWYGLSNQVTHNRLLLRLSRHAEAADCARASLVALQVAGARHLVAMFETQLAETLVALNGPVEDSLVKALHAGPTIFLSQIGAGYLLAAKAMHAAGQASRARRQLNRAVRVLEQSGDKPTELDARFMASKMTGEADAGAEDGLPHLDAAVALLELSGHPPVMAREAVALLEDVRCTERLVLGVRDARGVRVVFATGWTDPEAAAALRTASDDDLIPIGQHRDETWVILVRPRPELDHRCTLAAVRKLIATARSLDQYRRDEKQRAALWPAEALEGDAESLWISEQSAELLSIARRIASAPLPVLLTGETGTGKEMLARVIHRASDRASRPMQPFNCTAVPRDMLESQLFGYRKGAFTGAEVSFPGVLRAAAGSTLFLDEIGDISLDVQPKLLRFLEHQEVQPLGEPHPITVDVRVIAATNANLETLVAGGRFREDLLYRLNVLKLHIPPLRERREEIPPLVQHYIRKFGDAQRKGRLTLSDETLEYLLLYGWPGNIRQLANEVRRMIALAEPGATLTPALLSTEVRASRRTMPAADAPAEPEIRMRLDQPLPAAIEIVEQSIIRRALERSHGRVEEAARLLGISRKGLFLKRRRWGLRIEA